MLSCAYSIAERFQDKPVVNSLCGEAGPSTANSFHEKAGECQTFFSFFLSSS
jgi:hypothetical protein